MISPNIFKNIKDFLLSKHIVSYTNQGITVVTVDNAQKGMHIGKELLYQVTDKKTALYLSGGKTPKEMYTEFAKEEKIHPGAVGMVDERYGEKWHKTSNEKMMKDAGLLDYLTMQQIPFYPILQIPVIASSVLQNEAISDRRTRSPRYARDDNNLSREETAERYDETIRHLFATFPTHIGLLGIGLDGHTAGIPAKPGELGIKNYELRKETHDSIENQIYRTKTKFVVSYNDETKKYGERVTMTFLALSMLDVLLVMVFGNDKKDALEDMFADGSEEEIPARFFKRIAIAPKTLFITDQKV